MGLAVDILEAGGNAVAGGADAVEGTERPQPARAKIVSKRMNTL